MGFITIPATLPSIEYTVTTPETVFNVPSYMVVWEQADLRVYVSADEGVSWTELTQADFGFVGTAGYSDGYPGGVLTLVAPIESSLIRIERDMTLGRATDFTEGAPISRAALNMAFDRLWAAVIDINARSRRGVWGQPLYESEEQPPLPADPAQRAGKYVGFDELGVLTLSASPTDIEAVIDGMIGVSIQAYSVNLDFWSGVDGYASLFTGLGLGDMALQSAAAVAITGGTLTNVAHNGGSIVGCAISGGTINGSTITNVPTATNPGDAVNLAQVQALAVGVNAKAQVLLATTGNIVLSGEQTIDGTLTTADDVLVWMQTNEAENGIYTSAAGAWTRRADANTWAEVVNAIVTVTAGSTNAGKTFAAQVAAGGTIGVTNMPWVLFLVGNVYLGSSSITLTGNAFSIASSDLREIGALAGWAEGHIAYRGAANWEKFLTGAFGRTLMSQGTQGGANTALGLVIGTTVQAWNANLDEYATVNPSAYTLTLLDEVDGAAWATALGVPRLGATTNDFTGSVLRITNSASGLPIVSVVNTNDDAAGPSYGIRKMPASDYIRSSDVLGNFIFEGKDQGGVARTAALVQAQAQADAGASTVNADVIVGTTDSNAYAARARFGAVNHSYSPQWVQGLTGIPAGGSASVYLKMTSSGQGIYPGSGAPTVSAAKGSLYIRSDGGEANNRFYVNTDGGTTWEALITAGGLTYIDIRHAPYYAEPNATILGDVNTPGTAAHTRWAIEEANIAANNLVSLGHPTVAYIPGLPQTMGEVPSSDSYNSWVHDQIQFDNNVLLEGDGPTSRLKLLGGTNSYGILCGGSTNWLRYVQLRHLVLDGNWAGNTLGAGISHLYVNAIEANIDSVTVVNSGGVDSIVTYDGGDSGRLFLNGGATSKIHRFINGNCLQECMIFSGPSDTSFEACEWTNGSQTGYGSVPIPDGSPVTEGSYSLARFMSSAKVSVSHAHMSSHIKGPAGVDRPAVRPLGAIHVEAVGACMMNVSASHFEGAQFPALIDCTHTQWSACTFYAKAVLAGTAAGDLGTVKILQSFHSFAACNTLGPLQVSAGVVCESAVTAWQLGESGSVVTDITINGRAADATYASIDATYADTPIAVLGFTQNNCGAAINLTSTIVSNLSIQNSAPRFSTIDDNAAADEGTLSVLNSAGEWGIYLVNDAGSGNPALRGNRTGNTVDWTEMTKLLTKPGTSLVPSENGQLAFEFTNNTTITVRGKGSDGTVRTATIAIA